MDSIFIQLAIILGLSSTLGLITHKLKLPLLIAYLMGGLLIATLSIFDPHSSKALSFLPEIGVAFVLFLVGMELDLREIKNLGLPILISGILQVVVSTVIGTFIGQYFGFPLTESIYLGVGLSFSSTIVIVKLLLDKRDLTSLYGKLALGITLLEDLLAVLILLFLTASNSVLNLGYSQAFPLPAFLAKTAILFLFSFLVHRFALSAVFKAVSKSGELLFLTALAWCFIYVSLAIGLGFSVVVGAFLAGIALASSPYHFQIQGKIKPLRDFFVALFFVYLGTQVNFADLSKVYPVILAFSAYAVLVKPLLFLLILSEFGFRKHTSFQAALSISQISEFSLIIILVGMKAGVATQSALTTIALSAVLSISISSLMISQSARIYKKLANLLGFFERKNYKHYLERGDVEDGVGDHVILIGGHRMGGEIVKFFKEEKIPFLVLDFNPNQVEKLLSLKVAALYGDMGDPEILDALNLNESRMVISTAQDLEDNLLLLEKIKAKKLNIPTIIRAGSVEVAEELYKAGADYVMIPEILAGDLLIKELKEHLHDSDYFQNRSKIELEKLDRKTLSS